MRAASRSRTWYQTRVTRQSLARLALKTWSGLLEQLLQLAQELGGFRPVDRAVIAGESEGHQRPGDELALLEHRPLLDRADREDCDLRRVEDGDELLDAVHAEVGDRERAALEVVLGQLAVTRACDDGPPLGGELDERLPLAVAEDGYEQAPLGRDRQPDVRAREDPELVVGEMSVHT